MKLTFDEATNEAIGKIRETVDAGEILCQLAEEAAELSQAALKLRRAITGANPTPVSKGKAEKALVEEIADVWLMLKVLDLNGDYESIMATKTERWLERLWKKS